MNETPQTSAPDSPGKWPADAPGAAAPPPLTTAVLANAAARAAASGARRDLLAYLQLRRKSRA